MTIPVACKGCGSRFSAKESHAGKRMKCLNCGEPIEVPVPAVATQEEEPIDQELQVEKISENHQQHQKPVLAVATVVLLALSVVLQMLILQRLGNTLPVNVRNRVDVDVGNTVDVEVENASYNAIPVSVDNSSAIPVRIER